MEPWEILVPLAAIMMAFGIPIVAILTAHQRRMAEIIHRGGNQMGTLEEVRALRIEVNELKQIIQQQMILLDGHSRPIDVSRTPMLDPQATAPPAYNPSMQTMRHP